MLAEKIREKLRESFVEEEDIDQAVSAIKQLLKERLPEKRKLVCEENCLDCVEHVGCRIKIRNQALSDVERVIEEG